MNDCEGPRLGSRRLRQHLGYLTAIDRDFFTNKGRLRIFQSPKLGLQITPEAVAIDYAAIRAPVFDVDNE